MNNRIQINMPQDVAYIINTLNQNGFKAYLVGGCVRDSLLGKAPKDWDIATDAQSENVKLMFGKIIETSIKHETVTAVINSCNYKNNTLR